MKGIANDPFIAQINTVFVDVMEPIISNGKYTDYHRF